ncbi:hypothetical protein FHS59_004076 [Algoriphagus iocasae]|uniref:6-bladed beta-propeller n=1 Tax=Algoriphagus iocasae TaxID=1836499 RepID=A0A841MNB4_9BACT|nr:hypothetical protein [Algoriphagus iocasae]
MDIFGCHCIKIFDKSGNYLSKIRAYGEGPGKYLDLDNFIVVNDEVLVLGVYPPKLMWFSFEGDLLREEKLKSSLTAGVFLESTNRHYFFKAHHQAEDFLVLSFNSSFKDTTFYFPKKTDQYYGNYSSRDNFIDNSEEVYFSMAFQDTIYKLEENVYAPKMVLDFGNYGQDISEYKMKMDDLETMERMDFINKKAKLHFVPNFWFVTERYFYSDFRFEGRMFNVIFDRKTQKTEVLDYGIINDLDEGYNPHLFNYRYDENKVGLRISGKDLYEILEKKKEELGPEAFEEYIKGKGKNLAQAAYAAKDSENPVLIIYTPKK